MIGALSYEIIEPNEKEQGITSVIPQLSIASTCQLLNFDSTKACFEN